MEYDFDTVIPAGARTPASGIPPRRKTCCRCGWRTWISARPRPSSRRCSGAWHTASSVTRRCRCLLQRGRRLVRTTPRMADRPAMDRLHDRRRPGTVGRNQGTDEARRPGDRTNTRLQLLLLVDPQQRVRIVFQRPVVPRWPVHRRFRRPGGESRRPQSETPAVMQPAQPRRTGLDTGRVATHGRNLPAPRRAGRGGPRSTAN